MKEKKFISDYRCRVYYEDVDAGGICYHSKYLNFCERARSEFFFSKNASPIQDEHHFVVKNIKADFHRPAHFGEEISVHTYIKEYKKVSLTLYQEIKSENGTLLFGMDILLVCLRGEKISKIPDTFLEIFGI
jgi:acyl-CoA thioester hydrolase